MPSTIFALLVLSSYVALALSNTFVPCYPYELLKLGPLEPGVVTDSLCISMCEQSPNCTVAVFKDGICQLEDWTLPMSSQVDITEGCHRRKYLC